MPFKVSGPTLSACEAENNATVELTKEVLDIYLVYNWSGFRNIGQMIIEGDNTSNDACVYYFSQCEEEVASFYR